MGRFKFNIDLGGLTKPPEPKEKQAMQETPAQQTVVAHEVVPAHVPTPKKVVGIGPEWIMALAALVTAVGGVLGYRRRNDVGRLLRELTKKGK